MIDTLLGYLVAIAVAVLSGSGGYILLRRTAVAPAIVVFEKTISGYKEMVIVEERQRQLLQEEKAALLEQLRVRDDAYKALEKLLEHERGRSSALERMAADWLVERGQLSGRISTLEAQVRQLQAKQP